MMNKSSKPISVLAKYEPEPPNGELILKWDGERMMVRAANGWNIFIPLTEKGLILLQNTLREHYFAAKSAAKPLLGSTTYPTQHQIDQYLRMNLRASPAKKPPAEPIEEEPGF